jgi:hypothetical protein
MELLIHTLKNLVKWPFQPTLGYVTYLGANIGDI